jgi:hypothetical protein
MEEPEPPPSRQILIRPASGNRFEVRYSGDRSTGEANGLEIASAVIYFLNESGEQWGAPRETEELDRGADMIAYGPAGKLRLQITRVPWNPELWAEIGRLGHAATVQSADEAAGDLITVIRAKAAKYSSVDRASLVLVLDGTRTPSYDLPPTLAAFRHLHLAEALETGFEDIFLVGLVRFINLLNPPQGPEWFSVA